MQTLIANANANANAVMHPTMYVHEFDTMVPND
jgi:hypothetical protein